MRTALISELPNSRRRGGHSQPARHRLSMEPPSPARRTARGGVAWRAGADERGAARRPPGRAIAKRRPPGGAPRDRPAPRRGLADRVAGGKKGPSLADRADERLIGRRVAVPYHYYIADDESGCCCDGTVTAVGAGRGLIVLETQEGCAQGEQWHPLHLIRRWLQPEVDPLCDLLEGLPSISPESARPPPVGQPQAPTQDCLVPLAVQRPRRMSR